ncbi:unnamed protein product [Arctia plantaginis]|uniref:Retroviral polymerase SH3-like domain-containing protein n=1 Tax=Arctia plantaginis TaxID=874455 RepID=A0A8S1B966_ARCPL|nr:unnamed protein product [Arctia plantaginis]
MLSDSNGYWHIKFAHQNYKYVKEFLDSRGIKYEEQTDQCLPCIQGKQHRLPFGYSSSSVYTLRLGGKLGVFVGYNVHTKGYRVWYPNIRKVETHRDIIFVKEKIDVKKNINSNSTLPESEESTEKDEEENQNQKDNIEKEEYRDVQQQEERNIAEDVASSEVGMMEEYLDEEFLDSEEVSNNREKISRRKRQVKKPAWTKDYDLAMIAQEEEQFTYEEALKGYTDADWAGNHSDRKSTSGYVLKVFGDTVSWSSNKQQCV